MLDFKTDSIGDTYSNKYSRYVNAHTLLEDTLEQLEKNYEEAFGQESSSEEMKNALKFVQLFLAEIGETCPKTKKAMAASEITSLIDEDDPIKTADNISHYRTK